MCCRKNLYDAQMTLGRCGQVLTLAKALWSHLVSCTHQHHFPFGTADTLCFQIQQHDRWFFFVCVCWCYYQFCTQLHSKTDSLGVCKRHLCSRARQPSQKFTHKAERESRYPMHRHTADSSLSRTHSNYRKSGQLFPASLNLKIVFF